METKRKKEVNFLVVEKHFTVEGIGEIYDVKVSPQGATLQLGDILYGEKGEGFEIENLPMIRVSIEDYEKHGENHMFIQIKKDSRVLEEGEVLVKNAKIIKISNRLKLRKVGMVYAVNVPSDVDILMGDKLFDRDDNSFIVKGIGMPACAGLCSTIKTQNEMPLDLLLESEDIDEVVGNELLYVLKY